MARGELLASTLSSWIGHKITITQGIIIFTVIGGAVVGIGTTSVDMINRLLFTAKVIFLIFMLVVMLPPCGKSQLNLYAYRSGTRSFLRSRLFLPLLVFHGSVPQYCQLHGWQYQKNYA